MKVSTAAAVFLELLFAVLRHREQQIVVDVSQLVGPLVSVHDTLTLLSELDCFENPPCSLQEYQGITQCCLPPGSGDFPAFIPERLWSDAGLS